MQHPPISAAALRRHIYARQQQRTEQHVTEQTYSTSPSIIYAEDDNGAHGNFLAASYKRICANPAWRQRLEKRYTAESHLPRSFDRRRGELECANSSDALLMNVFCYPRILHRPELCALLGIERGLRPQFGVRAHLAMHNDETDRTELDMCLGDLAVEAKLTETAFAATPRERLLRYKSLEEVFDVADLPWTHSNSSGKTRGSLRGYQLVRGVLAAHQREGRFLLLTDGRRADLQELCFSVLRAVRSSALRSRITLLSWQELAQTLPPALQIFLHDKYGIVSSE